MRNACVYNPSSSITQIKRELVDEVVGTDLIESLEWTEWKRLYLTKLSGDVTEDEVWYRRQDGIGYRNVNVSTTLLDLYCDIVIFLYCGWR